MILFTLFIDAIFTDMGRFTLRALYFDFLHSYLYYATPKDILAKLDNRLERIETKLEVLPKIETEVSQLKEDVKDLKGRATA
ncbi:hypothetical protein [Microcystis aeruginosa]|uniref:hypothetical protein n=1 Tax=Microcystis aeruginosa TaxID=1126 RepID=UPI0021AB8827|nr:hypothetical protein [Microcystis aeruginosa]